MQRSASCSVLANTFMRSIPAPATSSLPLERTGTRCCRAGCKGGLARPRRGPRSSKEINSSTGDVITTFGEDGHALLPGRVQGGFGAATAGPAIFKEIIVVPGFEKDVWGFDVVTGKQLWTFHTVPHAGEFGYDTWDRPESYA